MKHSQNTPPFMASMNAKRGYGGCIPSPCPLKSPAFQGGVIDLT